VQYVSKDKREAVLFAFRTHQPLIPHPEAQPPVYPRGLDPEANYSIDGQSGVRSGLAWMQIGISLYLADFQSAMLRIRKV
jgi:hypothetical protein